MYGEKKLEDHILGIYYVRGNAELRWSQIRNEIKSNHKIPEEDRSSESLSVKLSRALTRLCKGKDALLKKHSYGHQNIRYSLTEIGEKKLFSSSRIALEKKFIGWGAGCYTPGCSFEDYIKRMKQQWMELFHEEYSEEALIFQYEEAKARSKRIPQVMIPEIHDEE